MDESKEKSKQTRKTRVCVCMCVCETKIIFSCLGYFKVWYLQVNYDILL